MQSASSNLTNQEHQILNSICYHGKRMVSEQTENAGVREITQNVLDNFKLCFSELEGKSMVAAGNAKEIAVQVLLEEAKGFERNVLVKDILRYRGLIYFLTNRGQIEEELHAFAEFRRIVTSLAA